MTAAQLRTRILASARIAYQGYAESNIDLNLPRLPDLGNVVGLLDGSTDQYAWYRSPGLWRSDVLTSAGEEDTYQTSQGTFIWSYSSNLLTEVIGAQPVRLPRAADLLPPALALRLLGFAGPADRVSRLPTQRVAGIDAAGLRLVPASAASTIGSVDIWADPVTGLPVQVEVFGKGTGPPVLTTRFLDLSLARPPLSTVTPNPAPEVGYSTTALPNVAGVLNGFGPPLPGKLAGFSRVANPGGLADVAAYGSGFARFAVLPLPQRVGASALAAAGSAGATIRISGGTAVLVRTALLTVLLVQQPSGAVDLLAGAVTPGLLERAASQLLGSP